MSKNAFYAVKQGFQPGVYTSWEECVKQVKGFSGAKFKKFPTYEAASTFVNQRTPDCSSASNSLQDSAPPPGKYATSLMPAELQPLPIGEIRRVKGNSKMKTGCPGINKYKHKEVQETKADVGLVASLYSRIEELEKEVAMLKGKHKSDEDASSSSGPPSKQRKMEEFEIPKTMVHVYTDGACTNNGFSGAKAGIGVYWGPDHPLNVSERLPGRQTNNRAEIQAAVRALQQAKSVGIQEITVYTDSSFLINGVTKWVKNWKRKDWKLSNGQPVVNRTDFEDLEKASAGLSVKWVHVPGHKGVAGNEAADYLAVQGIKKDLDDDFLTIE